ncbi:TGS domain-containing protein, partial [Enterococcus gallinarum]|uniref:TGS domain-containing protein n=1 Tax=Enterococcus gallinarum TaxID=1353 RepID=UPI003D149306
LRDWQNDLQQQQVTDGDDDVAITGNVASRAQIFVFTPHGDVKDLPAGSTPVDFAYRIHSNLGDRIVGARVISTGHQMTPRLVPLDYVLENGQIVE